jgi:hypothetical protein
MLAFASISFFKTPMIIFYFIFSCDTRWVSFWYPPNIMGKSILNIFKKKEQWDLCLKTHGIFFSVISRGLVIKWNLSCVFK